MDLLFSFSSELNGSWELIFSLLFSLVLIPTLILIIVGFFGRLEQKFFSYSFGPKFQLILGGVGAGLHELFQMGTAVITGHSLRFTHSIVLDCMRRNNSLTNIDHYWDSHNLYQEAGDFLVGVVPLYLLSGIVLMWQTLLMGNPFTSAVRNLPLNTYLHISEALPALKSYFFSAFNGVNLLGLIFLLGLIELISLGYDFSINECGYAARGLILWAIFIIFIAILVIFTGFSSTAFGISAIIANFGIFVAMRAIFYLIVIGIVWIPFAIINMLSNISFKK